MRKQTANRIKAKRTLAALHLDQSGAKAAQFMTQQRPPEIDGFANMGKPIPFFRKEAGYQTAREMGCSEHNAYAVVNAVSEQLARDRPYEAMQAGMLYLDLTGVYRLFAVLLVAQEKRDAI